MEEKKVIIITGGSSGLGRYAAISLSEKGHKVYELSRRDIPIDGVTHITCDVTDETQVKATVDKVMEAEGRIDILINNAGYGISGAVETTKSEDSHRQLEVNLFGMDNLTRAVIPIMRKQMSGRIVCISSIAAIVPIPFQTWYSVSKAAINAYVMALQNEIRPYGISVCAVMPGDIATGFSAARVKSEDEDEYYDGRISRSVTSMERDEKNGMSQEKAGRKIAGIALRRRSRPVISLGFRYKIVSILIRCLPRRISNWLVGKIYG